ncbi:MAG: hypothetical protein PHV82_06095 [Victivallaceae bacterium]|nr:hypothetical protein [Victivallaceae bacterium]
MKNLLASLSAAFLTVIIYGCQSPDGRWADIARLQEQQGAEIEKISRAVKQNSLAIEKLKNAPPAPGKGSRDELVEAALLLLNNGPSDAKYQVITILGCLGGKKAEDALLKMLHTGSSGRNYSSQIISALNTMGSGKLREVVLELLKSGNSRDREVAINAFQNHSLNILKKSDLPLLENILKEMPANNNDYYRRLNLIKAICCLDPKAGGKIICEELETIPPRRQRELLYITQDNRIVISFKSWKKIVDALGAPNQTNLNTFYTLCDALGRNPDLRYTDIILPWADFAEQDNNFRRTYLNLLGNLRDPKAAKVFLKSAAGDRNYSNYLNNYPGIIGKNGEYRLVDADTMKLLLERREKTIARLNQRDAEKEARNKTEKDPEKNS